MGSYLFDANALVYWVNARAPQHGEVARAVRALIENGDEVYALSSSLNEIYYALHTHYTNEAAARDSIADIAATFALVDLTTPLVKASLLSDEPDYEDGLVRAAAETLEVDAIVTYDKKAFTASRIPKLAASALCENRVP